MAEEINVAQLKEFLIFRADNTDAKVDALAFKVDGVEVKVGHVQKSSDEANVTINTQVAVISERVKNALKIAGWIVGVVSSISIGLAVYAITHS